MKEMKRLRFRPLAEARSFGSGLIIGCILASMIYVIMYRNEVGIDHLSILNCKLPPSSTLDDAATSNSAVEEDRSILSTGSDQANEEDESAINSSFEEEKVLISGNGSVDEEEEGTKVKNDTQVSAKPSSVDRDRSEAMPAKKPICDFSQYRLDICDLEGDIRVIGKNLSSVMLVASGDTPASSWEIKPYPRKYDHSAIPKVRSFNVTTLHASAAPNCDVRHDVPGVLFSTGGHCGNCFHDFADVLVPLFQTSGPLRRRVRFAISSLQGWWMMKYRPYLTQLSAFDDVIDLDADNRVHCFDRMTVGLRANRDLMIDSAEAPDGYSIAGFVELTRSVFGLGRALVGPKKNPTKPRLLFIARSGTRKFANLDALKAAAEAVGFEAVAAEPDFMDVARFAHVVNSCDVLVGVHGAGLTNFLFLPTGAVVVQVVPFGKLGWIATNFYGEPAMGMNLEYIQYDISVDESTLLDAYPRDDKVFTDPDSIHKEGWHRILEVYLRQQSVRLDVNRFRPVLEKAYGLVREKE